MRSVATKRIQKRDVALGTQTVKVRPCRIGIVAGENDDQIVLLWILSSAENEGRWSRLPEPVVILWKRNRSTREQKVCRESER